MDLMNKNQTPVYFQHGWGFSGKIWDQWKAFTDRNLSFILDRGYFENSACKFTQEHINKRNVVITHSFGLHLIPDEILTKTDICIIFSGFIQLFSKKSEQDKINILLMKMLENFKTHPVQTLDKFYRNVYFPDNKINYTSNLKLNLDLLREDLSSMIYHAFNINRLKNIHRVIIIHGIKDRIIPWEQGVELHEKLPNSKFLVIEDAGHALPFTHSEQCWNLIKEEFQLV